MLPWTCSALWQVQSQSCSSVCLSVEVQLIYKQGSYVHQWMQTCALLKLAPKNFTSRQSKLHFRPSNETANRDLLSKLVSRGRSIWLSLRQYSSLEKFSQSLCFPLYPAHHLLQLPCRALLLFPGGRVPAHDRATASADAGVGEGFIPRG